MMIRLLLVSAAFAAVCLADPEPSGYAKAEPNNGFESDVNDNNAKRQLNVNAQAQWVGSGTGTARLDGVPGSPRGRTGYNRHSYVQAGYGKAGYGYGNAGYGYGNAGYGYGNAGYGYGNAGYGYGNAGYGHGGNTAYFNFQRGHGRAGY